jgi:HK97 family phage prohead protease
VATAPAPDKPRVLFSWSPGPYLPGGTYVGTQHLSSTRVSRADALSVVGVKKGRDLLASIATLPLETVGPDRSPVRSPLLEQIDPKVANVVTLAMTFEDLLFEGVSWWRVTRRGWDRFPLSARHVDHDAVSMTPPPGYPLYTLPSGAYPDGVVWVMGGPVNGADMIRFDSPNGPMLEHGARAIRRALKLARASEMYADDPEARAYWTPVEGADPASDDDIEQMLDDYEAARARRGEAYIPAAVKRNPIDVASPADLQLVELQRRSDLEIANLMGLDPEDLGISTTTRTYANATDRRQDRINTVFSSFMEAVTGRLSLNDITRRGHRVRFNLNGYLRADPATRWATYGVALDRNVKSVQEVRAEEDLPDVPVEPRVTPQPALDPGGTVQQSGTRTMIQLSAELNEMVTVSFSSVGFAANREKRTVTGMVLPFGVATSDSRRMKFAAGSVSWPRSAVSQVKLDREHDRGQLLGAATRLSEDDSGISGAFKVARTPGGDEALVLAEDGALDGLSAVVEVLDARPDPAEDGAILVTSARLRRVTLTSDPAFSDARVATVAASAVRTEGNLVTMPEPQVLPATPGMQQFTVAVDAFTAAVQALGQMPAEHRATINPTRPGEGVQREPLIYRLNGLGHSFVRDAWDVRHAQYGSPTAEDAMARLRKYQEQTAQLSVICADSVAFANAGNTTDQADIIPPGYRPDLYVGQLPQGRPLFDAMGTRVALTNATPFKVPYFVGSANLSGTNSEGTGPSTGTITDHNYRTVTPTAQSGEFVVTRELMDSSNPAIDVIALNAMREEYSQDTEAVIAAHIADYTDDGSPAHLVSATSGEGCYVYTVTGTGNDLYIDGIRFMEGEFPGHRFLTPDRMLASPTGYGALLRAVDDVGRPMFPFTNPSNAGGTTGRAAGSLNVDGMLVPNAWSMTSTYNDVVAFSSPDILVGESPMLTFRFEEKGGPENIYLNIWAYFATQILRPAGVHAINYTAA